jgi:hypothetical protein
LALWLSVLGSWVGFYRYKLRDVIRVTSFHKNVLEFEFIHYISVVFSVHLDKTDKEEL